MRATRRLSISLSPICPRMSVRSFDSWPRSLTRRTPNESMAPRRHLAVPRFSALNRKFKSSDSGHQLAPPVVHRSPTTYLPDDLSELADLVEVRVRGMEDQLVRSDGRERFDSCLDPIRPDVDAPRDHVGEVRP